MRANVSVLTTTAQTAVESGVEDFQSAVVVHVGGDLQVHRQTQLYATYFAEPVSGHFISGSTAPFGAYLLRMLLTGTNSDGTGDGIFEIPVIATGTLIASVGSPPIIVTNPADLTVNVGQSASFFVDAISGTTIHYQWRRDQVDIAAGTASSYTIPSAALADSGAAFMVGVYNAYGSVSSTTAHLTVLPATSSILWGVDGSTLVSQVRATSATFGGITIPGAVATGVTYQIKSVPVGTVIATYNLGLANETSWQTFSAESVPGGISPSLQSTTVRAVVQSTFSSYYEISTFSTVTVFGIRHILRLSPDFPILANRRTFGTAGYTNHWRFITAKNIRPGDFLWHAGSGDGVNPAIGVEVESVKQVNAPFLGYSIQTEAIDYYLLGQHFYVPNSY